MRVAMSDLFRSPPTVVRRNWAFRDFTEANIVLDAVDEQRERERAEAERGR